MYKFPVGSVAKANNTTICRFALIAFLSSCAAAPDPAKANSEHWQSVTTNLPQVSAGKIKRFEVSSQLAPTRALIANRTVDVWLPPDYPDAAERYAVVYMLDGQMLFDAKQTWNQQEWGVDEIGTKLQAHATPNSPRPFIVVGIHNAGAARASEYFPQAPFNSLPPEIQLAHRQSQRQSAAPVYSDAFLQFLTQELKPGIDLRFRTSKQRRDTMVIGASMGGLMAWYALVEHPNVFGAAGCMSTHWPGGDPALLEPTFSSLAKYFQSRLPKPEHHRIWFDFGTQTLDALYPPLQARVDESMTSAGYGKHAKLWRTMRDEGAEHSENAWRKRLPDVLRFLLAP
jgi:predicted alpha/beta superfamily hydrolase